MEEQTGQRGSETMWARVFEEDLPMGEEMSRALGDAREQYYVRRWWKYGQPAIDIIQTTLDIPLEYVGTVVQDIIKAQSSELQIKLEGFPNGMPYPEFLHLNVTFQRNLG